MRVHIGERGKRLADHSAKACMGVDETAGMFRDHDVMLVWSGGCEDDVPGEDRTVRADQSGVASQMQPLINRYIAQSISGWRCCIATHCRKACQQKPDAIQASGRVSTV